MGTFSRKSTGTNPFMSAVRRHPFAFFGLPFLSLVVFSSFALQTFTQTRYDHGDYKVQAVSKEDALRMDKDRKKVDIREEYFRLQNPERSSDAALGSGPGVPGTPKPPTKGKKRFFETVSQEDYEPIRVPRPAGVSEWGGVAGASEEAPVKGHRKEDRWV